MGGPCPANPPRKPGLPRARDGPDHRRTHGATALAGNHCTAWGLGSLQTAGERSSKVNSAYLKEHHFKPLMWCYIKCLHTRIHDKFKAVFFLFDLPFHKLYLKNDT